MHPEGQFDSELSLGVICPGVGHFAQGCLDEALGLTVGLGRLGHRADVPEAEPPVGPADGDEL